MLYEVITADVAFGGWIVAALASHDRLDEIRVQLILICILLDQIGIRNGIIA